MSDLLERLQDTRYYEANGVEAQAADEIERLRAALEEIQNKPEHSYVIAFEALNPDD